MQLRVTHTAGELLDDHLVGTGVRQPQFLDPQRGLAVQFVVMAATFAVVEFLVELLLALLAFRVRPWLQRGGRAFNRSCGVLFVLIGVALPLAR